MPSMRYSAWLENCITLLASKKKLKLAIESSSKEDNSAVDNVVESMEGIADDLPGLMERCELEVEDLIKLVTTDMQQAFEEIAISVQ